MLSARPKLHSVTAPATDDGRSAACFHDVVVIHRTNGIRVLEHHLRVSRDQGEKIAWSTSATPVPTTRLRACGLILLRTTGSKPVIGAPEDLVNAKAIELVVPQIVLDEFERNKALSSGQK
jgi:hypothetical protein